MYTNKEFIKQVLRSIGAIACVYLGGKFIYDIGCQQGTAVSEYLMQYYEPEAYQRLCKVVNDHKK